MNAQQRAVAVMRQHGIRQPNAGQITRDPVQLSLVLEKLCPGCDRLLSRDSFYARPERGPTAIQSRCKECQSASALKWNRANADKVRATVRANPEGIRRAQLKWRSKQPAGWQRKYEERRDPVERREREARRRARKRERFVEVVDVTVVFERDRGLCGICGNAVDPSDFHLDHVRALANGGEHSYANVQIAHPLCNQRKGARW